MNIVGQCKIVDRDGAWRVLEVTHTWLGQPHWEPWPDKFNSREEARERLERVRASRMDRTEAEALADVFLSRKGGS